MWIILMIDTTLNIQSLRGPFPSPEPLNLLQTSSPHMYTLEAFLPFISYSQTVKAQRLFIAQTKPNRTTNKQTHSTGSIFHGYHA